LEDGDKKLKIMEKRNELKVQQYDASEASAKKSKILKVVATGVGATALVTMLGCYGLRDGGNTSTNEYLDIDSMTVKQDLGTAPIAAADTIDVGTIELPMSVFMLGGNGAWFNSVIEFPKA
jgi:hypothetical protein